MLEPLLIALLFLAAVAYVARLAWRSFAAPAAGAGCAKGCGTCAASTAAQQQLAVAPARLPRS